MHLNLQKSQIINLEKSITRTQAKAVHKDLPPNGVWRTIRGHHVYIVNGKIVAGSLHVDGKAKKATKAHIKEFQAHIDKEAKGADKNAKAKKPTKKAVPKTSAKESKKSTGASKAEPAKGTSKTTKQSGAKKSPNAVGTPKSTGAKKKVTAPKASEAKKPTAKNTAKKAKDIRTEAQQSREVAYDVGEKIGGARKDEEFFKQTFVAQPSLANLDQLESISPKLAHSMIAKANILPKVDTDYFKKQHKQGVALEVALLKGVVYDRVAPKAEDSPEGRRQYLEALGRLQAVLEPVKTMDEFKRTMDDMKLWLGHDGKDKKDSIDYLKKRANDFKNYIKNGIPKEKLERPSYLPAKHEWDAKAEEKRLTEHYKRMADKFTKQAESLGKLGDLSFGSLGEKFKSFFTNSDSANRSYANVQTKVRQLGGWDKLLANELGESTKERKKGETKKQWERVMPEVVTREGGRKNTVKKPEELSKNFGFRGVEFGHWVDDTSGKFHLEKASEAFSDLADVMGMDDKLVSMNGRLAIAFGARGKGKALAHYESDRRVINLTKEGGAGTLAHEWGHALDNILWDYSHDGKKGGLGFVSDSNRAGHVGDKLHQDVRDAYEEVMKTISEGDATTSVSRDDTKWRYGSNALNIYNMNGGDIGKATKQYIESHERALARARDWEIDYYKNSSRSEEKTKKANAKYDRELNKLRKQAPQLFAYIHEDKTGQKVESIEVPTGNSWFKQDAIARGTYWSSNVEMFARAFEAHIEDRLEKQGIRSDYLVTGTKPVKGKGMAGHKGKLGSRALATMTGGSYPYPHGEERERVNKAMDKLIKAIAKTKSLQKALEFDLQKSNINYIERLQKMDREKFLTFTDLENAFHKRCAYRVANPSEVFYIPLNRLKTPYQTDQATNWDKVRENVERIKNGENLEPVVIGYDYDLHDGHHRLLASEALNLTHVPCEVRGTNEIEVQRAKEKYSEVWKSIITDPVSTEEAFPEEASNNFMYRGVGQKELYFILKNGYIKSKGKGNDEDQKLEGETCYSALYSQAEGYARSNYDLYNEKSAYVLTIRRPEHMLGENELGELVTTYAIPKDYIMDVEFIEKE